MVYKFHYDEENDILAIYNSLRKVKESLEVSENVVIDLDKDDRINGIEIFDAAEFFSSFNESINKNLLSKLDAARIEYKNFRNQWILLVVLSVEGKQYVQPMPPLRKTEFSSPLLAEAT